MLNRSYKSGDEVEIVNLLNQAFDGEWGNTKYWEWAYPEHPQFKSENIFIVDNGNVIGHRSLHSCKVIINGEEISVAFVGDSVVHPDYRNFHIYSKLHQIILQDIKERGFDLIMTENGINSITYNHNLKTGISVMQTNSMYLYPINYRKLFKLVINKLVSYLKQTFKAWFIVITVIELVFLFGYLTNWRNPFMY